MLANLLTWAGASVDVSISTQRRMPSRMAMASKGLAVVSMLVGCRVRIGESRGTRDLNPSAFSIQSEIHWSELRDVSSALLRCFARRDLLHQFDNTAPQFDIGDARERAGQCQALGGRQEIGNVGRRAALAETLAARRAARASLEQK